MSDMSKSLEFASSYYLFLRKKNASDFCILPKALPTSFAGSEKWPLESNIRSGGLFWREFLKVQIRALKKSEYIYICIYIILYIYVLCVYIYMCTYIPLHICIYIYTVTLRCVYIYIYIYTCSYVYTFMHPPRVGGSSTYVASWICQSRPKLG